MNIQVFESYEALCGQVADEICLHLKENPRLMLCIAAGHTSLGVFDALIERFRRGEADFSKAFFVAMDEWLGMSAETEGSCGDLLRRSFLNKLNFPAGQIRLFDGAAPDPNRECAQVEAFIRQNAIHGVIDYLVLGAGMNGHLALNEPGTPFAAHAHVTSLDPVTQRVGQKYFNRQTALSGGLTLGIDNFQAARRSVLLLNGEKKAEILKAIVESPVSEALPATALRENDRASLYCDKSAVALLEKPGRP